MNFNLVHVFYMQGISRDKKMDALKCFVLSVMWLFLLACGNGGGGGITEPNPSLIADAGRNQSTSIDVPVILDGSASTTDGDGELTYQWSLVSVPRGSAVTLSDTASINSIFTPDQTGHYKIKLVITYQNKESRPSWVTIFAYKPEAFAGQDRDISTGVIVKLDSSESANRYHSDETLFYNWTITLKPSGSDALLSDPFIVNPTFKADKDGVYKITLVVNNSIVSSEVGTVVITSKTVPVANARSDQVVSTGFPVTVDGQASSTSNGAILSYIWSLDSLPVKSSLELNDTFSDMFIFIPDVDGIFEIGLVVNNGTEDSKKFVVSITAAPPTANAGLNQTVSKSETVILDGSDSKDPSERELTFEWALISRPAGSIATLSDSSAVAPTFKIDTEGEYIFSLRVSNGMKSSEESGITIFAFVPVANGGLDLKASTGITIAVDGSGSFDKNGYPLTYNWVIAQKPNGSQEDLLNDSTLIKPFFTPDVDGTYELVLTVDNGFTISSESYVSIVSTTAPVANAGTNRGVSVNEGVILDGGKSSDVNDALLSYSWVLKSNPGDSVTVLNGSTTVNPTFLPDVKGEYEIGLVVNNGIEDSEEHTVLITAELPIADAGRNFNVQPNSTLVLDGRGSVDSNDNALTYSWRILKFPIGSVVNLSDLTAVAPSLFVDLLGGYEIGLSVNNSFIDSTEDVITINVRQSVGNSSGIFSADFEVAENNNLWSAESGVWQSGRPTSGPKVAYIDNNVFGTVLDGKYLKGAASRLISPSMILPIVNDNQEIQLSFYQWFSLAIRSCGVAGTSWATVDKGKIQLSIQNKDGKWGDWDTISKIQGKSQGWTRVAIDLTKYKGEKIRIGLFLVDDVCRWNGGGESTGWYVDEFLLDVINR